jgi:small-conductance mechanosensitive channel
VADVWDLIVDVDTVGGRLATTAAFVVVAVVVATLLGRYVPRRFSDPFDRYVSRKLVRYVVVAALVLALAILWRPFAGRLGVVLGVVTAGVAFAMQEVISAFAGWISIFTGRLYRVGDRVDVGGVRGDVVDVTPLRTKLMEMGSPGDDASWVGGRQLTGRLVSVSNRSVFTDPVYNYSASFDFIWEELVVPVPYDEDWRRAEQILSDAVRSVSSSDDAREAIAQMRRSYLIPPADLEPRVFVRLTDDWVELAARFVVPVRTARSAKDDISRHAMEALDRAGIHVASSTSTVTIRREDGGDTG